MGTEDVEKGMMGSTCKGWQRRKVSLEGAGDERYFLFDGGMNSIFLT